MLFRLPKLVAIQGNFWWNSGQSYAKILMSCLLSAVSNFSNSCLDKTHQKRCIIPMDSWLCKCFRRAPKYVLPLFWLCLTCQLRVDALSWTRMPVSPQSGQSYHSCSLISTDIRMLHESERDHCTLRKDSNTSALCKALPPLFGRKEVRSKN